MITIVRLDSSLICYIKTTVSLTEIQSARRSFSAAIMITDTLGKAFQYREREREIFDSSFLFKDTIWSYGFMSQRAEDCKYVWLFNDSRWDFLQLLSLIWAINGGGENKLVTFNASKPKLITFRHQLTDPEYLPIAMYRSSLLENPLHWTPDIKWNLYIRSIAKRCWKNNWFSVPLQKVLDSSCYHLPLQETDQVENRVLQPYLGWDCSLFTFQFPLRVQKSLRSFASDELSPTHSPNHKD